MRLAVAQGSVGLAQRVGAGGKDAPDGVAAICEARLELSRRKYQPLAAKEFGKDRAGSTAPADTNGSSPGKLFACTERRHRFGGTLRRKPDASPPCEGGSAMLPAGR